MKWNIFNNKQSRYNVSVILFFLIIFSSGCYDYPMDDNGLLITERGGCFVSSFALNGVDGVSVTIGNPAVDTTAQVINALVHYGADLKNLYPRFTLDTDCQLEPKVTGLTDFSSLSRQWTVISGNRKIRKTYTVNITVQMP